MSYMTMFPSPAPEMPQEFMEAVQADPGAFATAMGQGMEAFSNAMQGGADAGGAFDAMGDAMGPMLQDMGISTEAFEAAGDAIGDCVGPAMQGMPADAGPGDMADCMSDAVGHMMPEGADMPAEMGPMFENMGETFADNGMGPHEVGTEMGPDMPGEFVPGDPTSFPEGEYGPAEMGPPTGDMEGCTGDMAGCHGDMTGVTGDMTGCVGDMTGCSGDMTAMTGDVSGVTGDMTGCSGDMTGCAGDMGPVTGDVTECHGDMAGCTGDMTGCSGNMGPVTGDMSPVTGDVCGCYGDMGGCEGSVTHVTGDMGPVTGDMSGCCGHVTGCEGDMSAMAGDCSMVTGNMAGCSGDMTNIAGDMTAVNGDCSAMSGDVTGMEGDMTGCSGDMTGCTGNMTAVNGDMSEFSGDCSSAAPGDFGPVADAPAAPPMDPFDTAMSPAEFASPAMTEARAEVNDAAAVNGEGNIAPAPGMPDMPPVTPDFACGTADGCQAASIGELQGGMASMDEAFAPPAADAGASLDAGDVAFSSALDSAIEQGGPVAGEPAQPEPDSAAGMDSAFADDPQQTDDDDGGSIA